MLVQVNKKVFSEQIVHSCHTNEGLNTLCFILAYCHHYHVFLQDNHLAKEFNLSTNNNKNNNNFSEVSNLFTVQQQTLS
jgi:hypothetical protein